MMDATDNAAWHCARNKERQKARQARGRCRQCGRRRQPGSRSRCPACLEADRLNARLRRGITTRRPRHQGRPLIGPYAGRRRAFDHDLKFARPQPKAPPTPVAKPGIPQTTGPLPEAELRLIAELCRDQNSPSRS